MKPRILRIAALFLGVLSPLSFTACGKARKAGIVMTQLELAASHDECGDIALSKGNLAAAKTAYTAALEIRKSMDVRDTELLRDLSISHNELGDISYDEGISPQPWPLTPSRCRSWKTSASSDFPMRKESR